MFLLYVFVLHKTIESDKKFKYNHYQKPKRLHIGL